MSSTEYGNSSEPSDSESSLFDEWESPPEPWSDAQPPWLLEASEDSDRQIEFRSEYEEMRRQQPRQINFYYGGQPRRLDSDPCLSEDVSAGLGTRLLEAGIRYGLKRMGTIWLQYQLQKPLRVFIDHDHPSNVLIDHLRHRDPMSYFLMIGFKTGRPTPEWVTAGQPVHGTYNWAAVGFTYEGYIWTFHTLRFSPLTQIAAQRLREWLALFTH